MAQQKEKVNKTAEVRAILEKDPKTPVKYIVSQLAAKRIKISDTYVYMIKSAMKRKKRKEKRQKAMAVSANGGISDPVKLIHEVKSLAERAGGIRKLKELVTVLAE